MNIKDIADYCLKCKNPNCIKGCPAHNDIPKIMNYVSQEQYHNAYRVLLKTQILPDFCGNLCAYDHQCEGKCVRGIKGEPVKIGLVESTLASMYKESFLEDLQISKTLNGSCKVVVIGGGITGITSSLILSLAGAKVTLYEKEQYLGGTVKKYIPNFRFSSTRFNELTEILEDLNVTIKFGYELGNNLSLDDLSKYDYKIICYGAENATKVWTVNYPSCFLGLDILKDFNKNQCLIKDQNVIVIGAGNVAMDVARSLKRLNNNVTIVYRRNIANSPASKYEIEETIKDGVNIAELWSPIAPIINNDKLVGLQIQKMTLTKTEPGQRQNVIPVDGAISLLPCDVIVFATGAKTNKQIFEDANIDISQQNYLNYYYGGDFYTGPKTVVEAMTSGKKIAEDIIDKSNNIHYVKNIIKESNKPIFFGGSFNPPTLAHYNILKFLGKTLDSEVLVVPNGDDYHYHNKELLAFDERINMLELLTSDLPNIKIIKSERDKPFKGSVETLKEYNHPWFVIGADSIAFISSWINAKKLIKQNKFIVFNRQGFNIQEIFENDKLLTKYRKNFLVLDLEFGNISSSSFRENLEKKYLTKEVYNYIIEKGLYMVN